MYALHLHHRVFRSEGEVGLRNWLEKMLPVYKQSYQRTIQPWKLHDIQNLIVLCVQCHEGQGVGVHGGNEGLRQAIKHSFTEKTTGFNVPFYKDTFLKAKTHV